MRADRADVVVVGGGLVGSSLACALEGSGLDVVQVEVSEPGPARAPSFDERNLALALASVNALTALGVWRHLPESSPIRRVHVSSRGDFGSVRLEAADHGLEAFGAVVVARELGAALEARAAELRGTRRLRPARVVAIEPGVDDSLVRVEAGGEALALRARLVVGADGTASGVREALGIGASERDYGQTLFVAVVALERTHEGTAWERFGPDGPTALLPLTGRRAGSVCTVPTAEAAAVAALDEDGYRELLQGRFGWRAGRFGKVGARSAYPMAQRVAAALIGPRAVLAGNAAQTLHPIGAQGFNLGLRDALTLAELLHEAARHGGDPGDPALLARHAEARREDRERTIAFTDDLLRLFREAPPPLRLARSLGLVAMDRLPGLATGLVAGAMGFRGEVPRLARGAAR